MPPFNSHLTLLAGRHLKFKKLVKLVRFSPKPLPQWPDINEAVLYAVIGQMLSVKAAHSIINRLHRHVGDGRAVLEWAAKNYTLRGPVHGVSRQKRQALKRWLDFYKEHEVEVRSWHLKETDHVRRRITSIWGFGNWAADMVLIFHLAKMDVWSVNDKGIIKGSLMLLGKHPEELKELVKGAETAAALCLWQMIDEQISV